MHQQFIKTVDTLFSVTVHQRQSVVFQFLLSVIKQFVLNTSVNKNYLVLYKFLKNLVL